MVTKRRKRAQNTPKTTGYNVRKSREAQKFTAEQLAEKIRMRVSYVHDIENDEIPVGADMLYKIAMALGTTVAELKGQVL